MGATLKVTPGGLLQLLARMLIFHSANQPMMLKKSQEKIEWGDQVCKDDGFEHHNEVLVIQYHKI